MDSGIIIIGIITLLICILPFVLMARSRKIKNNQMLHTLAELAQTKDCKITTHEFCGELLVGIDENKPYFFLHKQTSNGITNQAINLSEMKSCEIVNTKYNRDIVQKLELKFISENTKQADILVEFYNRIENFQLSGEIQLIEKWVELIKEQIRKPKK